jgi:uncharacterized protein (DUF433 family)
MATETVSDRHIVVAPGVAGGKPRVAGRRITVQNIVIWHEWMGLSAGEIAAEHSTALSDVCAALTYYDGHRDQIDQAFVEELHETTPSKLPEKLCGRPDQAEHG